MYPYPASQKEVECLCDSLSEILGVNFAFSRSQQLAT